MECRSVCTLLTLAIAIAVAPVSGQRRIVPADYEASLVSSQGGSCPTATASQMSKDSIIQNVQGVLRDYVVTALQCGLGECPENPGVDCSQIYNTNPGTPSGWYYVRSCDSLNPVPRVYCEMGNPCGCSGPASGWTRIAFLNMSDPNQQCPESMETLTTPIRTCDKRIDHRGDCASVTHKSYGQTYSRVCGRVVGYQIGSPDAFSPYFQNRGYNLEDPYVDGVSLTYGHPRQHIWTFANGVDDTASSPDHCPCTGQGNYEGVVPPFIGNDYFCETAAHGNFQFGRFYTEDPVWNGQGCVGSDACCTLNNPNAPYFCKSLTESTTEDLELRLCVDQALGDENNALGLYEIYVQ